MTTEAWPAPARCTRDWGGYTSPTEAAIEDAIVFGGEDYSETDRAVRIIHALTGRCHHEIVTLVDELLTAADEVADAEPLHVDNDRYRAAVDDYHATLTRIAQPRSFDGAVTEALSFQEPAEPAPLRVLTGGAR